METPCDKSGDEKLPEDLRSVMSDFFNFQERYTSDHKELQVLKGIVESQAESIRLARDAEANEKQKAIHARLLVTQQQSIVDNFQQVMQENLSLVAENKNLKKMNEDMLKQMKTEVDTLEKKQEFLKNATSKEIDDIKQSSEQTVKDLRNDMELRQAEFEMKQQEMEEALNSLHGQKYEELNITTLMYEEKLQKFEESVSVLTAEHEIKLKEHLSTIAALKLRNSDLERKLIDLEKQRKILPAMQMSSSYRLPLANQRQGLTAKKTSNYASEFNKTSWNQLQVEESRKSSFKPLPLATEIQSIDLEGEKSGKKTGEREIKRRKLFVQRDDL